MTAVSRTDVQGKPPINAPWYGNCHHGILFTHKRNEADVCAWMGSRGQCTTKEEANRLEADWCMLGTLPREELGTLLRLSQRGGPGILSLPLSGSPLKDLFILFTCVYYLLKGKSKFLSLQGTLLTDSLGESAASMLVRLKF